MPRFLATPSPRDQLETLQRVLNKRSYGLNNNAPVPGSWQGPVQKAQLLIGLQKIQDSITMDEDANGCYKCEDKDEHCKYLQKEIEDAVKLKLPTAKLLNKACGGEGRVFIYNNSVVKAMPMSKKEHEERVEKCQMASQKRIGPNFMKEWFLPFRFIVEHEEAEETRWAGWSCVQTEKLIPVQRTAELLSKVMELARKAAWAGVLYTDARLENIMQTPKEDLRFVDLEASILFTPREGKNKVVKCQFCLLAEAFMLQKLTETLSDDNRPNFTGTDQQDLIDTFKAKKKLIEVAWTTPFVDQVQKFLQVIDTDCAMKGEIGRVLDPDFGRNPDIKINGCENAKR